DDPRCFYSGGVLYFSIQGDGDATAADIYVSNGNGLFSNGATIWNSYRARLRLVGVDVRYGGIDLRTFRQVSVKDCSALGAPVNGFDVAWWAELEDCEAAGSGSYGNEFGDGFNWHDFTVVT